MRPGSVWVYEIEEQKARVGIALQGVSSADEETKGVRKVRATFSHIYFYTDNATRLLVLIGIIELFSI